jgi:MFS-type transporter involved in bile tolerance (Atg22 family)
VENITGGMRNSVAALAVFFVMSLIVLAAVKIRRISLK